MELEKAIEHDLTAPRRGAKHGLYQHVPAGSSYFRAVPLLLATSKRRTPAATPTFRDPAPSLIGMATSWSQVSFVSRRSPCPSAPRQRRTSPARSASQTGAP